MYCTSASNTQGHIHFLLVLIEIFDMMRDTSKVVFTFYYIFRHQMSLLTNKTLGGGVTSHPQGKFYMVGTYYKCIISTTTSLEIVVSTFVEQGQPWPFSLEFLPET